MLFVHFNWIMHFNYSRQVEINKLFVISNASRMGSTDKIN